MTRRGLGTGVLLALPAVVTRPATTPRSISLVAFGGWFQTGFDTTILGAFRKAHPDIAVSYDAIGNSFQIMGMLREQRGRPSTDVVLLEKGVAIRAAAEGLLDPLDAGVMPIMKDLIPRAAVAGGAGPALMLDSLAMAYTPALVSQTPRSWRTLWDAIYAGRIALQTPPDPAALAMTAAASAQFGGGDLARSLDLGVTALTELMPRVVLWDPLPDIYTAIAQGDAGIGPGWNARAQSQAALTPRQFAASIPDEGSPVRVTTINLVKGSPQPEAARLLIAWLLGPKAQRLLTETMFYAPVNAQADIPAGSLVRAGASPATVAGRIEMDWIAVDAIRAQVKDAWRKGNPGGR